MKMPTLPKMKMPKLPKLPKPQPKRLQATARRAAQPVMEDYDEEPTTRLSSAFIVVLILHVVAVGGIYAFNSIKAHRRGMEPVPTQPQQPQPKNGQLLDSNSGNAPAEQASTGAAGNANTSLASQNSSSSIAPISGSRVHHVKNGETLSRVASIYSVGVTDLEQANGLKAGTALRAGQTLNIPAVKSTNRTVAETKKTEPVPAPKIEAVAKQTPATSASPAAGSKTYTVKKGDNPVAIAKKFNVSYDELLKLNKIDDPKKLRINQTLKIPGK